jgi:glycosyltransferase involved in cell wall biosynthesis
LPAPFDPRPPGTFFGYVQACEQSQLRQALRQPADLFFANYVFTAPLLDLLPSFCPRLVETHDLYAHQWTLLDRHLLAPGQSPSWVARARKNYLFRLEIDLLRLYDVAVMITDEDLAEVAQAGLTNAMHVPPLIRPVESARRSSGATTESDLLFVGGDNVYNVTGIEWFFSYVYLPYLARHRVRLAVAGQVCRRLHLAARDVRLLGLVPTSLDELYRSTRLVIAPMLEGTGIPIKTLDGLAHGKAVVATPVGRRGVHPASEALVCVDMQADPEQAAAVILDLLADERKRQVLGESGIDYIRQHHGQAAYERAMDAAVERALRGNTTAPHILPETCPIRLAG